MIQMDEKTETYLLTNKGIEKLDASKELSHRDMKSLEKISDKDDNKGGRSMMPLRHNDSSRYNDAKSNNRPSKGMDNESKLGRPNQGSFYGNGNQRKNSGREISMQESNQDMMENKDSYQKKDENYRTINDKLNQFLANQLDYEAFVEDKDIVDINSNSLYQCYAENVDLFSERFNEVFSEDLEANIDDLAITLIKDMNDLWKFLYFIINCIKNLSVHRSSFNKFVQMMESFCTSLVFKDSIKIQAFFKELFLNQIVLAIKKCQSYEKREKFVRMIYYFYPNDPKSHHEAIKTYKEKLDNTEIFLQSLCIFLKEETDCNDSNKMLIKDFKHYAKFGMSSLRCSLRLSALHLMSQLALINYEWVQKHLIAKLDQFGSKDWWEIRVMFLIVVSRVLKGMSESEPYLLLIKKQNQSMVRAYNPENEILVANMKEIIDRLSNAVKDIFETNYNEYVYRIAQVYFADMLTENKHLVEIYVNLQLNCSQDIRIWALYNQDDVQGTNFLSDNKNIRYGRILHLE